MTAERDRKNLETVIDRHEQIFGYRVPGAKYAPKETPRNRDLQTRIEKSMAQSAAANIERPTNAPKIFFIDRGVIVATAESLNEPEPPGIFGVTKTTKPRSGSTGTTHHEWGKDRPESRARARERERQNGYVNSSIRSRGR